MRAGLRVAIAAGACVALLAAPPALAGPLGHSRPAALPSVLPPTPLPRPVAWARSQPGPPPAGTFARGEAVLGLTPGVDGRAVARRLGVRVIEQLRALRAVQVAASPARLAGLARRGDPQLRYVEPVVAGRVAHARNDPLTWLVDPATHAPWEWQFHAVGLDAALGLARGDPGILVGVVDSGVSTVPDLRGKVAETFWDKSLHGSAVDVLGHGTFVSSIIASRNDDGFGLAGFCGACRLAVYKAVPVTDVQVAQGIRTLTDAHVRVINLSVVVNNPSQVLSDAIGYATSAGVLVVAAAGNDGTTGIDYPASLLQPAGGAASTGIAVGASDAAGRRASFSNSGPQLSLLAPGTFNSGCTVGILGALPAVATDFGASGCGVVLTRRDGARYAYAGGTSFAAPEVAGVAALVWSAKPSLTSIQVASILEQTATRPAGTGWTPASGWGVLNAKAALEAVTGRASTDSLVLSGLTVSRPRETGSRVEARVVARWGDGQPVVAGAKAACRVTVGGTAVSVSPTVGRGLARCAFTVPRHAARAQVAGSISVSAPGAATAAASFRFSLPG